MNKFIIFLGCNKKQIAYLKRIKLHKYNIILVDQNSKSAGIKFSDYFFKSSYTDFKKLNKIYSKFKNKNIKGVFTASSQFAHLGCAHLAKKFKLKYPLKKNINICLSKSIFYKFAKKNGLKIPKSTYIENRIKLSKILKKENLKKILYLKSDYGKSPYYIYSGTADRILKSKINWKKDKFLRKNYVLQNKFYGKNLRINLYKNKFEIYDFNKKILLNINSFPIIKKFKILNKLKKISKKLQMQNWILKFDIIVSKNDYVVLDVGMDPPSRMLSYWKRKNKDFIGFYLSLYLGI